MFYTPTEIADVLSMADACLYTLPKRMDEDVLLGRPSRLERELAIIYDLRSCVNANKVTYYSDETFHGVVTYLRHKVSGYGIGAAIPYYATVVSESTPVITQGSGYQLFKQIVINQSDITAGSTVYTNIRMAGRYVTVILDGVTLPQGVDNTESYVYNISTGTITFNTPLDADRILQIYTYIPTLAGWSLLDSFAIGDPGKPAAGATVYANDSMIGKSVIVSLSGLVLPLGLADVFSFTFDPLTGIITFNNPLPAGEQMQVYTY